MSELISELIRGLELDVRAYTSLYSASVCDEESQLTREILKQLTIYLKDWMLPLIELEGKKFSQMRLMARNT